MAMQIRRREFIVTVGAAAVAWPLDAHAQQPALPVIRFLSSASRDIDDTRRLPPFRQGLNETGYTEGQNVAIEYRGADEQLDRLPGLAADLARRQVSLIGDRWQSSLRIGGEVGDRSHSNCVRKCGRSRADRLGCKPQPAGWKRNRLH